MTAGRGVEHSELSPEEFLKHGGPLEILQKAGIPSIASDDGHVTINLISGEWNGQSGRGRNVFLYVVRGEVKVRGKTAREFQLVELEDDGDDVALEASRDSLVIFGHAAPLNEPVVARGPFVMNTQQEIVEAARDYYDGKFR